MNDRTKDGGLGLLVALMLSSAAAARDESDPMETVKRLQRQAVPLRKGAELIAGGWSSERVCELAGVLALVKVLHDAAMPLAMHQGIAHKSRGATLLLFAAEEILQEAHGLARKAAMQGVEVGTALPTARDMDDLHKSVRELAKENGGAWPLMSVAQVEELTALRNQREQDVEAINTLEVQGTELRNEVVTQAAELERLRGGVNGTVYFALPDNAMRALMNVAAIYTRKVKQDGTMLTPREGWSGIREHAEKVQAFTRTEFRERDDQVNALGDAVDEAERLAAAALRFVVDVRENFVGAQKKPVTTIPGAALDAAVDG